MTTTPLTEFNVLNFDNKFVRDLPGDASLVNRPRQVKDACYSRVLPVSPDNPSLVAYSREMGDILDLGEEALKSQGFTDVFSGKTKLAGMDPYAMCYGGHQFGNWAGQLGDGRAINLGEVMNSKSERWALQLKGSGPTPYSRRGDGFAVLRSSIREFLCSEAMFHLGVPTTRALSLVLTGEEVIRDMFYDGHPKAELGAVVCRVAPSFVRFGNFQILPWRGEVNVLKKLVDYTIQTDFPHLGGPCEEVYHEWFDEVCQRTALMIAHWMRVGFVHGVMNTDNMSILGLTIDYGPYGWIDNYDPGWTPNTTDKGRRRYRFGQQAQIAQWNLMQLAGAIERVVDNARPLEESVEGFENIFQRVWQGMMANKLGLREIEKTDAHLIEELNVILQLTETDMTIFHRRLADLEVNGDSCPNTDGLLDVVREAFYKPEEVRGEAGNRIANWLRCYRFRAAHDKRDPIERREQMNAANPIYVLRNYLAQEAIELAEKGDNSRVIELLETLRRPYSEQAGKEEFAKKRPDWARTKPGCSMLSCSS
jgi:serine/tyrosine/threonine adenylyltransferase